MENVYEICFYGGLILAILLLITAIVLFVVLKIPKAIGDLTGRTAKKAMRDMRDENKAPGSIAKKEQEKYYNMGSGKITAKETVSSGQDRKTSGNDSTELLGKTMKKEKRFEQTDILRPGIRDYDEPDADETEILGEEDDTTDILQNQAFEGDDGATDVLTGEEGDDGATDVLTGEEGDDGATDVLTGEEGDDGATDVLTGEDDGATDILSNVEGDEDATSVLSAKDDSHKHVKVIYNVVVVHTDETIE